jgi:hypothetical protein
MSQPIVVTLPHQLGKAEALRRLKASFSDAQPGGGGFLVVKNQWSGDHLDFRASVLGQSTTGTVDVADDHVRLEVQLPWLLSLLRTLGYLGKCQLGEISLSVKIPIGNVAAVEPSSKYR